MVVKRLSMIWMLSYLKIPHPLVHKITDECCSSKSYKGKIITVTNRVLLVLYDGLFYETRNWADTVISRTDKGSFADILDRFVAFFSINSMFCK